MKILTILLASILLISCEINNQQSDINTESSTENKEKIKTNASVEYTTYCNTRYSFCIEYPSDFTPNGESANGDGQTFSSADEKTLITVYGNLVDETDNRLTLDSEYGRKSNDPNIAYKKKGEDYYVISRKSGDYIDYEKTVHRKIDYFGNKETDILVHCKIRYPISQKKRFNEYCKKINNDF